MSLISVNDLIGLIKVRHRLLANSSILYMLAFVFVFVALQFFCCSVVFLSIDDMFPSVLVCNPNLFSLIRFFTFENRYTTVAFICLSFSLYIA